MQGREAGEPIAGPPRYSYIDPAKKSDRGYSTNYTLNNNSAGLDLNSVWSIERNVKVKSSLSQPSSLNSGYKHVSGGQQTNRNFYSRYSNAGDARRPPSVPGSRSGPARRSPLEPEPPSDPRAGSAPRTGSAHSGTSVDRGSGSGDSNRGSANGPRFTADKGPRFTADKGFDPLADEFW